MSLKITDEDSLSFLDKTLTKLGFTQMQKNGMYLTFCGNTGRYFYAKKPMSFDCPYCKER